MKKLQTLCIIIMLFCVSFKGVYAQEKTAYQKKIVVITQKYFNILSGNNRKLSVYDQMTLDLMTQGEDPSSFLLGIGIMGYAAKHSEVEVRRISTQIKNELKQAESLKTVVDFKREKNAKEQQKAAQAKKEREENERELKAQQDTYEKTDVGSIKQEIKSAFEKWNLKGEFEKEIDYKERLKTQSQESFSQICIDQIQGKIQNNNLDDELEKELSIYNSEKEFFTVSFKINGVEWQNKINISIANAEEFKNNWSHLRFKIDDYDWCFIEKSLCPTLIILHNGDPEFDNHPYEFHLSLKNQSEITYFFNDLEIANTYLKDSVFKYSKAKSIAEKHAIEKQRLDSLDLVPYYKKLDSIFMDYNRQLLQNPYNATRKIIGDYSRMVSKGNKEDNFNSSFYSLKSNFEKINNNIERELRSRDPAEYCRVYYLVNPNQKEKADKKYLDCKCHYQVRLNFDLKFISSNLNDCNCRDNDYQENGKFFINKDEFDSFYDKGNDVLQAESTIRWYKTQISKIVPVDLKDVKNNNGPNERMNAQMILSKIASYKDKPYYSKFIDFIIETNKAINKEWSKKGEFFENKVEFYEAYISGNYKQILKLKKH